MLMGSWWVADNVSPPVTRCDSASPRWLDVVPAYPVVDLNTVFTPPFKLVVK
jgi:hypothetical protein